jgi:hypothetical protein
MTPVKEEFLKILFDDSYGICTAPTPSGLALNVLCDYILGEDWYIAMSMNQEQAYTVIVDNILTNVSAEYRKDVRRKEKEYETSK